MSSLTQNAKKNLLKTRICDLKLSMSKSMVECCTKRLYAELEAKGLSNFRPEVYIADEWFSPQGVVAIGVPFYLFHPALKALELNLTGEVEGGSVRMCMQLLRHETGHCFDHAYKVSKSKEWRKLFGDPKIPYHPESFVVDPTRKDCVKHFSNFYSQSHPDEDFAETFAVWLNPKSQWRKKYRYSPRILAKLKYINELAQKYGDRKPKKQLVGPQIAKASRLRKTLAIFYKERVKTLQRYFG